MGTSEPLWLKRPPFPPQYPSRHNASVGLGGRCIDNSISLWKAGPLSKLVSLNLPSTAGQFDAHRKRWEELGYKERANLWSQRGYLGWRKFKQRAQRGGRCKTRKTRQLRAAAQAGEAL